jgi:MerR family transcriptional regulator, copper efflux regulator
MRSITIGQLAKAANVGVETVRFYERKGLLAMPARQPSGYRQYAEEAVQRLGFIKRAQRLGFTLKEISELLALQDDPDAGRADVRERVAIKLADIDLKIRDLQAMSTTLRQLDQHCQGDGPAAGCPIITALLGAVAKEPLSTITKRTQS